MRKFDLVSVFIDMKKIKMFWQHFLHLQVHREDERNVACNTRGDVNTEGGEVQRRDLAATD